VPHAAKIMMAAVNRLLPYPEGHGNTVLG
jgi:hypothetical protein